MSLSQTNYRAISAFRRLLLHVFYNSYSFLYKDIYEGWNFNSGNYLFTTDTK